MYSKKEYERKISQLEKKLEKQCEKNQLLKQRLSKSRSDLRYVRKMLNDSRERRDAWKAKYKAKQLKVKALEIKLGGKKVKARGHQYEVWLVSLCIALRIYGKCSYRGVARIIKVLNSYFGLELSGFPCANTVRNWVAKVGLNYLRDSELNFVGEEVCLIIDESIRVGREKLLLILVTSAQKIKGSALRYSDVAVCHLKGSVSWTGELIEQEVKKLKKQFGFKVRYILSDEDSKLLKSCRLLDLPHVPDISHAVGSCLRKTFSKNADYQSFTKLVVRFQQKSVNQILSFLRPPKLRMKSRFMNQRGLINWAKRLLEDLEKLGEKERTFFKELKIHVVIISLMDSCLEMAKQISLLIKTEGISAKTIESARGVLKKESSGQPLINVFKNHMNKYLTDYQKVVDCYPNLEQVNGCSDIIESLFGTYKNRISANPLAGVSLLSLELPLCCLKEDEKLDIKQALEDNLLTDLEQWRITHSADNQLVKRMGFFKKRA